MKKLVTVTTTHDVEIEIPDHMLTPAAQEEFGECIGYDFDVNSEKDRINFIFTNAAYQIVTSGFEHRTFIEGLGEGVNACYAHREPDPTNQVVFDLLSDQYEFELHPEGEYV